MNLIELKEHLEEMLLNDVDPNTPVCIPVMGETGAAISLEEIAETHNYEGRYHADPSPKMCAFIVKTGKVIILDSNTDLDNLPGKLHN